MIDMKKLEEFCSNTGRESFYEKIFRMHLVIDRLRKRQWNYAYVVVGIPHDGQTGKSKIKMDEDLSAILIHAVSKSIEIEIDQFRERLPNMLKPLL